MTKKEIIAEIQGMEASYWLALKRAEVNFGENHVHTGKERARWGTLCELMHAIGIQADPSLPNSQEATKMILEKYDLVELIKH
jgi:hypothetical protein